MTALAEPAIADWPGPSGAAVRKRRIVVGIGEFAVSNDKDSLILTHGLGSCVAVCLWDPHVRVAGLVHVLLPDSRINLDRAGNQPAAFADTGIPLLLQTAYGYGVQKQRCQVRLVGGADINGIGAGTVSVGKRNILAVRGLLWSNGVMLVGEAVGGGAARSVSLDVGDGRVQVRSAGREAVEEL